LEVIVLPPEKLDRLAIVLVVIVSLYGAGVLTWIFWKLRRRQ
jgi:hypothetical protein